MLLKIVDFKTVWGGRLKSEQEMYVFECISIARNLFFIKIALIKTKDVNPRKLIPEFIKSNDILGFEEIKIHSTRIMIIGVRNPEYWLKQETSTFRKKMMEFNISNYGSSFNIAAAGLDISPDELNEKLNSYFEKNTNVVQEGA